MRNHDKNPNIQVLDIDPSRVARYSTYGSYPLYYLAKDGGVLSAEAVEENIDQCCDPDEPQWYVVAYDTNYDNPELYCSHTNKRIESAYAEIGEQ